MGRLSCPGCPSPAATCPSSPGWPRRVQLPGGTDSFTGHNGNSSKAGSPLARLVPAGGGHQHLDLGGLLRHSAPLDPPSHFSPWGVALAELPSGTSSRSQEIGVARGEKAELWDKFRGFAMARAMPLPRLRNGRKRAKSSCAPGHGAQIPWVGTLWAPQSMCVPKLSVHQIISVTNAASM